MAYIIELTDDQWNLVADLFDPPGRRGAPAQIPRRQIVNAMLFLAPHRLPVALPPGAIRRLRRGLAAVAPLAGQWRLGAGDGAPRA